MEKKYLGIDLGTTNSSVAVFKGVDASILRNVIGNVNTPSVVRITKQGSIVGEKAKRKLHADPQNTFKEFKRLMGTDSKTEPDMNNQSWTPEQLSAMVLKNLKELAERQESCSFDKAVITVPALFELPQSKATAAAAQLAGFDKVELIPEPVASALASGWESNNTDVAWLVYDLGGGTFDVSLLETRDGLLRVVAHDGDNFLGGRDIDNKIVAWVEAQLISQFEGQWNTESSDFLNAKRHVEAASEMAKIRLSDSPETIIEIDTEIDDNEIQTDIVLTQDHLNDLCLPLIERSIAICKRMVKAQGLNLDRLEKVVLVGGPAHMPIITKMIEENLAPIAKSETDPMSLVAKGAAIYSATMGLACEVEKSATVEKSDNQVWLQYPSICTELSPSIMGRIIDSTFKPHSIQVCSTLTAWQSPVIALDDTGMFIVDASIVQGQKNSFILKAFDGEQNELKVTHDLINIVHGLTVSDPPLSRSIGIALANGNTRSFIDRGTPLPAKRTFTQATVETLQPGTNNKLTIPIVQGERTKARFCRNVGNLTINASSLKSTLSTGSQVEITIEVDRGGDLRASAFIAAQSVMIEGVAQLTMSYNSLDDIKSNTVSFTMRVNNALQDAFRERDAKLIARLDPLSTQLKELQIELNSAVDDVDTCQRLSRNLMEIEAEIEAIESVDQMMDLIEEATELYYSTQDMVQEYGNEVDKKILSDSAKKLEAAITHQRQTELERIIERLEDIRQTAHKKSPKYWVHVFNYWSSFKQEAQDLKRMNSLVENGQDMIQKNELTNLRSIVDEIYSLLPHHIKQLELENYDSGVY